MTGKFKVGKTYTWYDSQGVEEIFTVTSIDPGYRNGDKVGSLITCTTLYDRDNARIGFSGSFGDTDGSMRKVCRLSTNLDKVLWLK